MKYDTILYLLVKIRIYYCIRQMRTIQKKVLVLVILNARFIFTTTKFFARIIFRAVLKFAHPALREF